MRRQSTMYCPVIMLLTYNENGNEFFNSAKIVAQCDTLLHIISTSRATKTFNRFQWAGNDIDGKSSSNKYKKFYKSLSNKYWNWIWWFISLYMSWFPFYFFAFFFKRHNRFEYLCSGEPEIDTYAILLKKKKRWWWRIFTWNHINCARNTANTFLYMCSR